jgi:hypothetical protein
VTSNTVRAPRPSPMPYVSIVLPLVGDVRHIAAPSSIRSFETLVTRLFRGASGSHRPRPPSWHRLGPLHVPLEAKRSRHVAVAIPQLHITRGVAVSPRE